MPAESTFKKHVELVHKSFNNFNTIRSMNMTALTRTAIINLLKLTTGMNSFVLFFLNHALFQELVPAVFNTLYGFAVENPKFVMLKAMDHLSSLNDHVQCYDFPFFSLLLYIFRSSFHSIPFGPNFLSIPMSLIHEASLISLIYDSQA